MCPVSINKSQWMPNTHLDKILKLPHFEMLIWNNGSELLGMLDKVTLLFIPKSEVAILWQPGGQTLVLEGFLNHGLAQIKITLNTCNTEWERYNYRSESLTTSVT